jgi:DNA ligase (NAD+)
MTLLISKLAPDVARIRELTDLLNQANAKYRRGEPSGLTDSAFDKLLRELKTLEEKYPDEVRTDSPTQRIGVEPLSGLSRVKHASPMLSIDNVYSSDELAAFLRKADAEFAKRKLGPPRWVIEHKVDGAALSLIYKDGELVSARTRGDGVYGDDVLANARTISGVPLTLNMPGCRFPQYVEIRGEAYMKNSAFRNWNATGKYANPRNATAGAIRLLDPRECARRPLSFMAHTATSLDAIPANTTTQNAFLGLMEKAGFVTPRLCLGKVGIFPG